MSEHETEITTAGSAGIPLRRTAGLVGSSREVSKCDHELSGGTGRENEELEWGRRHVPDDTPGAPHKGSVRPEPAQEVFRKTELHRSPPTPDENEIRKLRSRMMQRLKRRDPEILYMQFETSFREFICSLLVRQYREENELRSQIAALWGETERLEERMERNIDRLERWLDAIEERGR